MRTGVGTEHFGELRPIEGCAPGAMVPSQAAAFAYEPENALADSLRVENRPHRVVQMECVILAQLLPSKVREIVVENRLEGSGLLRHRLDRDVGVGERAMAAVSGLHVDHEQFARLLWAYLRRCRDSPFDLLALCGGDSEAGFGLT